MTQSGRALPRLPIDPESVKGFLSRDDGEALMRHASDVARLGPLLEVGSYCGRSALYLGAIARVAGQVLFTIDHHRGSEEIQPGWAHHDPETWDAEKGSMDTLPFLRDTLWRAGLEDHVIPVVGKSPIVAMHWHTPLSFVFIDGGHSRAIVEADYRGWAPHIMPGGILAFHDVFVDAAEGGQGPHEVYRMALASGQFNEIAACASLRFLERTLIEHTRGVGGA